MIIFLFYPHISRVTKVTKMPKLKEFHAIFVEYKSES